MTIDPDQIRGEIQQTQRELSADVGALTEKLSPPRMVQRRARRTRAAMTNMKDKIMGNTASGTSSGRDTMSPAASGVGGTVSSTASTATDKVASAASSAADAASSAPQMARRRTEGNPLAAGLIAFGAGWLISSLLPATAPEQHVATQVKDLATEKGRPVAQQLGEAAQQAGEQLREPVRQSAESVKETVTDAAQAVAGDAQSAAGDVTGRAQQAKDRVAGQARPGRS
jgi:cell division septum initiation protein DivIVA